MFSRSITQILRKPSAYQSLGHFRFKSTGLSGLSAQKIKIQKSDVLKPLVPAKDLVFGKTFTDHMITAEWEEGQGWLAPEIKPFEKLQILPSAVVFHYALTCFEGLKAYKGKDGKIRLFRPDMNMKRMNNSVSRIALPSFDGDELIKIIGEYLKIDERWIPNERGYSLYLRPTCMGTQETLGVNPSNRALLFVIGCPVGPYYKTGFAAVSLKATTEFVRAWPRGTGSSKIGANYAPGILPQQLAAKEGYQQNLWLFGDEHELTEVGTMNLFIVMKNEKGEKELVTPPLDGSILPGVTRDSIIQLAKDWEPETGIKVVEKKMTMPQLRDAIKQKRIIEMFGAGTACIVSPIKCINYEDEDLQIPLDPQNPEEQAGPFTKRVNQTILDIQYGNIEHPWSVVIN
ncbi:aminotransferase [Umbelopsis sp. PMI_123]|nr:aminotransferase [Umbelopsis sp. PMI_123]